MGQELLRLLARHPGASVAFATAESAAGELLEGHRLIKIDDAPLARAEIVLSCLPHGVSARYVHETRAAGRRAVDLSADFRLSTEAVYGLTEVTRPRVAAQPVPGSASAPRPSGSRWCGRPCPRCRPREGGSRSPRA